MINPGPASAVVSSAAGPAAAAAVADVDLVWQEENVSMVGPHCIPRDAEAVCTLLYASTAAVIAVARGPSSPQVLHAKGVSYILPIDLIMLSNVNLSLLIQSHAWKSCQSVTATLSSLCFAIYAHATSQR